jgi:hypothetical protein
LPWSLLPTPPTAAAALQQHLTSKALDSSRLLYQEYLQTVVREPRLRTNLYVRDFLNFS